MPNRRDPFRRPDSKRVNRDRDAQRKAARRAKYMMQGRIAG